MNKKEQTVDTYNKTALRMAEKFRNIGARTDDVEKAFRFAGKTNPVVLEIGCGDGRDAKEILKRTDKYLGIDISKSMIDIARQYVPGATFAVADVESYAFPDGLDLIFSFASLLHSDRESVKGVLERAHTALNTGGIFYISLKCDQYREETKSDEFGTRTYYFYTPELIGELAGKRYEIVHRDFQELKGQKWFTLALRKNA